MFIFSIDKNGIGTLEFYHPQSNSLPGELLNKITNKITDASSDEKVKVIIIKSSGNRVFVQVLVLKNYHPLIIFQKENCFFRICQHN